MNGQQSKLWRTLVRVIAVAEDGIWLCIPGYNSGIAVLVGKGAFPEDLLPKLAPDYRFHAKVNTGVDHPVYLVITDFEVD